MRLGVRQASLLILDFRHAVEASALNSADIRIRKELGKFLPKMRSRFFNL